MDQSSALAAPRWSRHALRALVLLGGALLWWLMFSGGQAHADDLGTAPDAPLAHAGAGSVSTTVTEAVEHATTSVTSTLRAAPDATTGASRTLTPSAPEPVKQTIAQVVDAVEPLLVQTTGLVADDLQQSVDHTVQAVQATAVPAAHAPSTRAAEAPARAHISRSSSRAVAARHRTARPVEAAPAPSAQAGGATSTTRPAGSTPDPRRGSFPDGSNLPGSTTTASSTATGVLSAPALVAPRALLNPRASKHMGLPVGPAYPPGSSPD